MTVEDIMKKLEAMGSEQTKNVPPAWGPGAAVRRQGGDLKKLVKDVKKDQALARALYETGNSDAMYLAGLTVNPKTMDRETLKAWAKRANWYLLAEYTVAGVAAESPHALALARNG